MVSLDPRFQAVMLTGFKLDAGVTARVFGFTTKTGSMQDIVDEDSVTGWSPYPTSFIGNGGNSAFVDAIIALPTLPYAAFEFDMGEECVVSFFSMKTSTEYTLPACVLYGSHNPATSAMDTLQPGDVKLGTYSTAQMNSPDTRQLPSALSGVKFRYYRFIVDVQAATPTPVAQTFWSPADKTSGITLSSGNAIATGSTGQQWAKGTDVKTSGKWYLEVSDITAAGDCRIGIADSTANAGSSNAVFIDQAGRIWTIYDNYSLGFTPDGHDLDFAFDFDNLWIYVRYDGGDWNNDPTADPSAGIGGKHCLTLAAGFKPYVNLTGAGTATVKTAGFARAVPPGFKGWSRTDPMPPDGAPFLEFTPQITYANKYTNSDYDSIWGKGDRLLSGLIKDATSGGLGTVVEPFTSTFNNLAGGYFGTPTVGGFAAFQLNKGVFVTGIEWRGTATQTPPGFWQVLGGIGPGSGVRMHESVQAFNIALSAFGSGFHQERLFDGVGMQFPWPWYSISVFSLPPSPGAVGRFAEKMFIKVAHSSLDGGDRQNTGGATPDKEVTVTTDFSILSGSLAYLIDGISGAGDDGFQSPPAHLLRFNQTAVAGKYLKFEFSREVAMHEMVLSTGTQESYGVGPGFDPQTYGRWQWEGSDDDTTWTPVGPVWKFKDGCFFMLAPDPQPGVPGQPFLFWRMVLVSGTAFVSAPQLYEIIFNLWDSQEDVTTLQGAFSDDLGWQNATITLTPPAPPFSKGAFTDGDSDALTATVTLKQNPVLKVAFTDEGEFNSYSEIYPSTIVQTMLHVTGR